MKQILRNLLFLSFAGLILWTLVPAWFGVNIPFGSGSSPSPELLRDRLKLPKGFTITVFAADLSGARILRFTTSGDLLVSRPDSGTIVLLSPDSDHDGLSDGRRILIAELDRPHGIDFYGNWLYIAEPGAIGRILFDPSTGKTRGEFERIVTDLPSGGNHWSRTLGFGPDGWMYISIGSSCNVCEEKDPRRAAILRFQPDGSQGEIFAKGLRNTVGFDWHPESAELYGVDNGRDFLGDDFPPCEFNRIERGRFYGWPYANGNKIADPDFAAGNSSKIENSIAPVHEFGAHTAPLGVTFLRNKKYPQMYHGAALVAQHGSWNRTEKTGYQVVLLHFGDRGTVTEYPLITGFEVDDNVIGRPVDIAEGPDGDLYLSDDYSGSVYRITYTNIQ